MNSDEGVSSDSAPLTGNRAQLFRVGASLVRHQRVQKGLQLYQLPGAVHRLWEPRYGQHRTESRANQCIFREVVEKSSCLNLRERGKASATIVNVVSWYRTFRFIKLGFLWIYRYTLSVKWVFQLPGNRKYPQTKLLVHGEANFRARGPDKPGLPFQLALTLLFAFSGIPFSQLAFNDKPAFAVQLHYINLVNTNQRPGGE